MSTKGSAKETIKTIRRKTRRQHTAEEKIRIVREGLGGEGTVAELCRREGISQSLYYKWSQEFLEAGKSQLAGDVKRQATTGEVKALRQENAQVAIRRCYPKENSPSRRPLKHDANTAPLRPMDQRPAVRWNRLTICRIIPMESRHNFSPDLSKSL